MHTHSRVMVNLVGFSILHDLHQEEQVRVHLVLCYYYGQGLHLLQQAIPPPVKKKMDPE